MGPHKHNLSDHQKNYTRYLVGIPQKHHSITVRDIINLLLLLPNTTMVKSWAMGCLLALGALSTARSVPPLYPS